MIFSFQSKRCPHKINGIYTAIILLWLSLNTPIWVWILPAACWGSENRAQTAHPWFPWFCPASEEPKRGDIFTEQQRDGYNERTLCCWTLGQGMERSSGVLDWAKRLRLEAKWTCSADWLWCTRFEWRLHMTGYSGSLGGRMELWQKWRVLPLQPRSLLVHCVNISHEHARLLRQNQSRIVQPLTVTWRLSS